MNLSNPIHQRRVMEKMPVGEIWGVGRKLTDRLNYIGIDTALQLADSNLTMMKNKFSVVMERTIRELNGEPCIDNEDHSPKKQIICSRSFGQKIEDYSTLREALVTFAAKASERLRSEGQCTKQITAFIRTSGFSTEPCYSKTATITLAQPTADCREIATKVTKILDSIFLDGFRYAKAGVLLNDFYEPGIYQKDMFYDDTLPQSQNLMRVIDRLNTSSGARTLFLGGQGVKKKWDMRQRYLSPNYTTSWADLPVMK